MLLWIWKCIVSFFLLLEIVLLRVCLCIAASAFGDINSTLLDGLDLFCTERRNRRVSSQCAAIGDSLCCFRNMQVKILYGLSSLLLFQAALDILCPICFFTVEFFLTKSYILWNFSHSMLNILKFEPSPWISDLTQLLTSYSVSALQWFTRMLFWHCKYDSCEFLSYDSASFSMLIRKMQINWDHLV